MPPDSSVAQPQPPLEQPKAHGQLDEKVLQDWIPQQPAEALSELEKKYSAWEKTGAWSETAAAMQKDHTERITRWSDELEYFLVYSSITSAIITTFAAQSYPLLQPSRGADETATVLLQAILATQLQNNVLDSGTPGRSILATAGTQTLTPSRVVVTLNILLFSSLVCSVGATTFGILIKQWLHELRSPKTASAKSTAHRNLYLFQNMDIWRIESIIGWLFILLQVSALLFFAALLALLWEYHPLVAGVTSVLVGCVLILAITSIILPVIYSSCCYLSPPTYLLYNLTQHITYSCRRIPWLVYRHIRDLRSALIKGNGDEGLEGGNNIKKEINRIYPTPIGAIVPWDTRELLAISGESEDIDCRLIKDTALRYIGAAKILTPDDVARDDPIVHLILREELKPHVLLRSLTHIANSPICHDVGYLSSTIPIDFWIASLFKIMPAKVDEQKLSQEPPSSHANFEEDKKLAIFRALKYIEAAYSVASLWTPERRRRLLQALSLVAHHSPPQNAQSLALAHQLLTKHLSSDEVVKDSPWSLARDGIAILYNRLIHISKNGSKSDETRWIEATSLVPVLVRCCLLSNQRWKKAEKTDLETLKTSGNLILPWFADEFLGLDIPERVGVSAKEQWAVRRNQQKLASFIQAVGVCVTSLLEMVPELREVLKQDVVECTIFRIEKWHNHAAQETTNRELKLKPDDVLKKVRQQYDILNGKPSSSS